MTITRRSDIVAQSRNHRAIRSTWCRFLLTVLGGCQILTAAGTGPLLLAVGALSGALLVAAAWVPTTRQVTLLSLVLLGTVPFAIVGWTAIAPIVVMLAAVAIALPLVHDIPAPAGAHIR